MNENYAQKSQTLKDFDKKNENILALQNDINNLINAEKETNDTIYDVDEETEEDLPIPGQFSVDVEKSHSESEEQDHGGDSVNLTKSLNTGNCDANDEDGETYFVRKVLPHPKISDFVPVKQYIINRKTILKAIEVQSKQNTTHIDKYLDVAIRNFYGEFKRFNKSFHDQLIHEAIEKWKDWYALCPGFRNSPFIYTCYICRKGWWRLHTFREHIIKEHKDPNLKIATEPNVHEFYIAAYTDNWLLQNRAVSVISNCWKCGKTAKFHGITENTSKCKYRCQGCLAEFTTCTKLSEHESICKQYIEMKCNELGIDKFKLLTCCVCLRNFINQTELDVHMTECHLVRSDEPAFVKVKFCHSCCNYFHDIKYHDCPKKFLNIKCEFCFRKFTTWYFQHMHMQLNRGTFSCASCEKSMRECMAVEHLVAHSKNYILLYRCIKCKVNITLYDRDVYFNYHMKLHGKWVTKRQCNAMVLLPMKCINGEIVNSGTTLKIPVKDFYDFISEIPNNPDKQLTNDITGLDTRKEEEEDVIILDDNDNDNDEGLTPFPGFEEKIECIETDKPDIPQFEYDDHALQAQLDAEIQRDVEMEAAISKVFSESNAYQKFLNKETEESDEDLYEHGLIVDEKHDEVTIISDSDSEEANVKMDVEQSVQNERDKIEFKELELDLNIKTEIKQKPDYDKITVQVKKEPNRSDITLTVEDTESLKELKCVDDIKNKSTSDQDSEEVGDMPYEGNAQLYVCKECMYQGNYKQYVEHVSIDCDRVTFFCSSCSGVFPNLKLYTRHFVEHNIRSCICPECRKNLRYPCLLYTHLKKHILSLFVKGPIEDLYVISSSTMNYVFKCKKCLATVDLEEFFNHWEAHLKIRGKEEIEEDDSSSNNSGVDEFKGNLEPYVLKEVLDLLEVSDKRVPTSCVVCRKKFKIWEECKRHLIEHLYVDASLNKINNENQIRCQLCNMKKRNINSYRQHMRKHASLPLYDCDLCAKSFCSINGYLKHKKVHEHFSYICESCGSKFYSKNHLVSHFKVCS